MTRYRLEGICTFYDITNRIIKYILQALYSFSILSSVFTFFCKNITSENHKLHNLKIKLLKNATKLNLFKFYELVLLFIFICFFEVLCLLNRICLF